MLAGASRLILASAHRTDDDFGDDPVLPLPRAKRAANAYVRSTSLEWTILRPDALSMHAPAERILAATKVPQGVLSHIDLAATIRT